MVMMKMTAEAHDVVLITFIDSISAAWKSLNGVCLREDWRSLWFNLSHANLCSSIQTL